MLEKLRQLRKIEITLTDDKPHAICHCEYVECIMENGVELMRKTHREIAQFDEMLAMLAQAEKYVHPEVEP